MLQNDIFFKVHGVNGESTDLNHSGWSKATSYSWGASRTSVEKSTINYRNLIVHADIDKATSSLLLMASNGNKVKQVELSACKAGGTQMEYYKITLLNVLVRNVMVSDTSGFTRAEYEFEADSVKFQYWEQTQSGGRGAESRTGWDIKHNTSIF